MNAEALTPQSPVPAMVDARTAQNQSRDADAFLLDVRGFDEFAAGRAEGAVCIPLPDLERRAGDLPTDRPVLVMCQSGGRSAIAAERLRALGMDNITDIQGGLMPGDRRDYPPRSRAALSPWSGKCGSRRGR